VTTFSHGDRVRYATMGEDGLPLVRYGFIGGVSEPDGPIVVMLDGELGGDVVDAEHVAVVPIPPAEPMVAQVQVHVELHDSSTAAGARGEMV
jgi:hypothetical protein